MKSKGIRMNLVLILSLIGTVLIVLSVTIVLFLQTYQQSLIRNTQTTSRRTIAQVSNTMEEYLDNMNKIMELLQASLEPGLEGRSEFFDVFLQITPDVVAASTYDAEGQLVNCYRRDYALRYTIGENLSFDSALLDKYSDGYVSPPHVATLFEGYYPWVITMVAPLDTHGHERWVALDISCSNISSYINDIGIGQRGYCFLMDNKGNIVYHPQQQLIYSELKSENIELISSLDDGSHLEGSVIYTIQTLADSSWSVVGVSFVQEVITESVQEVTRILILAALVILVAAFIISAVLSQVLSKPIHDLARAMSQFEHDAGSYTYTPSGGVTEVRMLSASFSHMVLKIQKLMDTVRSEEINLRKTELRALQAQINPHFLYNTLDSISWMCEQGKTNEAVFMVNALAKLFRISISKGHELIPIKSELEHAESYLKIQAYRYKNQFTYAFDVEDDCLEYLCNKITLQPIIENAVFHGINGLVDEGRIDVRVRSEGEDIVFTVEDNGMGMDSAQVHAIMSKDRSDGTGIGIKNVNDRLKIYFGAGYGLEIDSVPDVGTCVYIRMPKVREEAEYEKR